jgi:cell division septal protein FtsQ
VTAVAVNLAGRVLRPLRRPRLRWLLVLGVLAAILGGVYLLWFRHSEFVAVEAVRIEGIDPRANDGDELTAALDKAARTLTTLDVQPAVLERAAAPFPLVSDIRADAEFPHKLTIHVATRRPVARIGSGEDARAVDASGVVLPKMDLANFDLPSLPLDQLPKHVHVEGGVADQVAVLAAAPTALLEVAQETRSTSAGVAVIMPGGIELRFGDPEKAAQKWRAAAAILADPGLGDISYVDLTSPSRAAAGGTGVLLPPAG